MNDGRPRVDDYMLRSSLCSHVLLHYFPRGDLQTLHVVLFTSHYKFFGIHYCPIHCPLGVVLGVRAYKFISAQMYYVNSSPPANALC